MPIIKSAKKRARQSVVRHERNLVTKKNMREAKKAYYAAVSAGSKAKAATALKKYQSTLDTAVKKNIIHKNRAARLLSAASSASAKPAKKTSATAEKAPAKKPVAKKSTAKKAPAKKPAKK